ncbi:hypothetical protein DFLDMN_002271 [Cupriavidus sp. H19C3]|uniref:cysteine-rich CWC family protein n=1 Tax=Cupriavidus sp. H19C3 TaxID=3241603 RepID=UPI003BF7DC88
MTDPAQQADDQADEPADGARARRAERCSRCGAAFVCGYVAGLTECWCAQQPFLPASEIEPDQHCLCPDCLRERRTGHA